MADLSDAPRLAAGSVERLRREGARLYDVRPRTSHHAERIPGAVALPLTELEQHLGDLPQGVPLVFYWTWPHDERAAGAAAQAIRRGLDGRVLDGGLWAWKEAGFPTEGAGWD